MSSALQMPPRELAVAVERAWETFLLRDSRPQTPHDLVYASAWRVCDRRMALELTQPDALPPFPAEVLAKFRRGNDRERDLLSDLQRIGRDAEPEFTVVGQQERFRLKDRKGREVISGKVDARLQLQRDRQRGYPLEAKAWAPHLVERIETFDDLFDTPWTQSGAYQLLSYLYGAGEPYGFMLLDRSGLPALLPVELEEHLDRMEEFLLRAERIRDHVEAGTLPGFINNSTECKRCPFYGRACNPPLLAGDVNVLTDPELEAKLHRWHEIKEVGKEFDGLDRSIKKQLRGVEHGIAGPFAITGRWQKYSRLELPEDVKKKYTVSDPKGRFLMEIEKV